MPTRSPPSGRAPPASGKANYAQAHDDPHAEEVLATTIVPADHTFTTRATLDLGDRSVTLLHAGRGHTAGNLAVHVPDADALLAGDLVEESAPPVLAVARRRAGNRGDPGLRAPHRVIAPCRPPPHPCRD